MLILRYLMSTTGAYETVKSTPSIMDETSAQVLEYIPYQLSISIVLTLNEIRRRNIFSSGGNHERLLEHQMY